MKKSLKLVALFLLLLPFASAFALIPDATQPYMSGVYAGVQGGYTYIIDTVQFTPQVPGLTGVDKTRHVHTFPVGAFLGYGHVFARGNLPYLGIEASYNYRTKYNHDNVNGKDINAHHSLSGDLLPGFFFDDDRTTLVYLRLGAGADRFTLDSGNKSKWQFMVRCGAGIEHQLIDNFYLRADYVLSLPTSKVKFSKPEGKYSANPIFNTGTIGLLYRF